MTSKSVAIIDGGGANIASLRFALERLGYKGELTVDPDRIRSARRVILPGVGDAGDAMARLRDADLDSLIPELSQPVLGICLGLQLLYEESEEGDTSCLGILPGIARHFEATSERSVPHMGWNQVNRRHQTRLLAGIPDGTHFYFVHSYALGVGDDTAATADYGMPFTAIAQHANFSATQFHPERSGKFGARLLQNFLADSPS